MMLAATAVLLALIAGAVAPQWLSLWLGGDFAARSAGTALWLAVGVAINSLAHIPFTLLQARERADFPSECRDQRNDGEACPAALSRAEPYGH